MTSANRILVYATLGVTLAAAGASCEVEETLPSEVEPRTDAACATSPQSGTRVLAACTTEESSCGDGTCGDGESCATCAADCGSCCGNAVCDAGETYETCREDCWDGYAVGLDSVSYEGPEGCPLSIRIHAPYGGRHPVFVYLVGTFEDYESPPALKYLRQMAFRGFVAASVEYPNRPGVCAGDDGMSKSCDVLHDKARHLFDRNLSSSALSAICAHDRADCDKGIVVAGLSQGGMLSMLAKDYDRYPSDENAGVRAVLATAVGIESFLTPEPPQISFRQCLLEHGTAFVDVDELAKTGTRRLSSRRLLAVAGEHDEIFSLRSEWWSPTRPFAGDCGWFDQRCSRDQAIYAMNQLLGTECAGTACWTDGGGWIVVTDDEVSDGFADHVYPAQARVGRRGTLRHLIESGFEVDRPHGGWSRLVDPDEDGLLDGIASFISRIPFTGAIPWARGYYDPVWEDGGLDVPWSFEATTSWLDGFVVHEHTSP